ncbi:MAG: hypothetical protein CFE26_05360 [Verrucomicrobiales bacterium VVV1]|nr:MAG: hypothetical protein CFE26_05360 [Verrucomicrobiales bacterium VVV1]
MSARPELESLVRQVASRHHRLLARKLLFLTLACAAGLCVAGALVWVLRGYSVPPVFPLIIAGLALIAGISIWQLRKMSPAAAITESDRFFGLKDAITSARHLAATAPEDPATKLQWDWLAPRLKECKPTTIVAPFPKRPAIVSLLLTAASVWLCLLPPSPAIAAAQREAIETQARIAESKEQLEQLIEALDKDIVAPEDKDAMKMDEFRKMVKAIDEHGDRAEAARQFARIEQKVRDSSRALDQKRDEETVKLAAAELAKAEQTEARQLGKKLDAKELKEAAEQLEKLAAKKLEAKDLKDPAAKKEKLTEAKEEVAKMRAVSKRLAAAGKQRQGARQAQAGKGEGQQGQGEGTAGEGAAGQMAEGKGEEGKPLEDLMAELDDAAAEMEKDLEEMEDDPDAEMSDEPMEKANGALGKLGKHLKGMHGKRMAKSKLDQLRNGLAQAQSFSQGQTQMLGLAQSPGGKEPGKGSSWSERKEKDDSQKNGQLAELKGQHGEGPSLSAVEEAESGSGVSGRRGEAKQREFARQTESFVQRDDVPESLKLGVRNYFEGLQSATPAEPTPKEDK